MGATPTSYVLGGTELILQTHSGTTNYYFSYFLHDGQGNARDLTNSTGYEMETQIIFGDP